MNRLDILRTLVVFIALFAGACGDKAECVIDTDCALRERCSADNKCVALGGEPAPPEDAGTSEDSGE